MERKLAPDKIRESAERKKLKISKKYTVKEQDDKASHDASKQLEDHLNSMAIAEPQKQRYREAFLKNQEDAQKDLRKRLTTDDFEPLTIIGRGAFGEVRLVRMKDRNSREVYGKYSVVFVII